MVIRSAASIGIANGKRKHFFLNLIHFIPSLFYNKHQALSAHPTVEKQVALFEETIGADLHTSESGSALSIIGTIMIHVIRLALMTVPLWQMEE